MTALPSTLAIETACLSAWPAIGVVHDGAWLWRYAQGYSKRSNSFQSLDPADQDDAAARILRLSALSIRHGIAPVFRVTPLAGEKIVEVLDTVGWQAFEDSRVLAMDLGAFAADPRGDVRAFSPSDPRWYRVHAGLSQYSPATVEILKTLLGLIAPEAKAFVVYGREGSPVAAALAVVAGEIGVYLNVVTDRTRRRQGHGEAVMRAALAWTRERGARHAAIQVLSNNEPAVALYTKLGFLEQYRYHYRRPQQRE